MNYKNNRLNDRTVHYNKNVAMSVAEAGIWTSPRLKGHHFVEEDSITIPGLLNRFTAAWNQNGVPEGAEV